MQLVLIMGADQFPNSLLESYTLMPFNRIRYDDAIKLLNQNGIAIAYGDDLANREEHAICRLLGQLPTFVTHYPSDPRPQEGGVIKFFSMKRDSNETLCCDLLLPMVGESVGGAVREGSAEICKKQFKESYMYDHLVDAGVNPEQFAWYFDVLKEGTEQSSGCGIGFERVVQSVLATESEAVSIKSAIELPRSPDYLVP